MLALQSAVDAVKKGGADYLDLSARRLVDVAIDILIGYLLLEQALRSDRKRVLAQRFILHALPRAKAKIDAVMSQERSPLDAYDALIGPLVEEED